MASALWRCPVFHWLLLLLVCFHCSQGELPWSCLQESSVNVILVDPFQEATYYSAYECVEFISTHCCGCTKEVKGCYVPRLPSSSSVVLPLEREKGVSNTELAEYKRRPLDTHWCISTMPVSLALSFLTAACQCDDELHNRLCERPFVTDACFICI